MLLDSCIDLDSLVSLLQADEVAAVRVTELAARGCEPDAAPSRLAECIASVDLFSLFMDLSEQLPR
jgi:hypothetical protein